MEKTVGFNIEPNIGESLKKYEAYSCTLRKYPNKKTYTDYKQESFWEKLKRLLWR